MARLEIRGVDRVVKSMGRLSERIQRRALARGIDAVAQEVLEEARRRVPVDTGALRDSLQIVPGVVTGGGNLVRRAGAGTVGRVVTTGAAELGGGQFYGAFVEFGTSRTRARPFMRPALDQAKRRAFHVFAAAVRRELGRRA